MRSVDMAEEMAHRDGDRLRRAPDPDRIARHLTTGLTFAPRPACPVCGTKGYRKAWSALGQETIFWCRRGHPHYVPNATNDPFDLENSL